MNEKLSPDGWLAHISPEDGRTQTIKAHLTAAAGLARSFAEPFGGGEQAYFAGLLHDIGKYSQAFQARLHGSPQKVDHSTAGAQEAFKLRQPEAAFCIAGHHSGLPDMGAKGGTADAGTLCGRLKKDLPDYSAWQSEISPPPAKRPQAIPETDGFAESFYIRMLYSCLVDADYLDTEAFMNGGAAPRGGYAAIPELLAKLRAYVSGWWDAKTALNRRRCDILRECFAKGQTEAPGLFSLTVPTGGGKTVSSLAFALSHAAANGKSRIIYVIPYTSIIDQTAEVFSGILGAENVIEHHSGAEYTLHDYDTDPAAYRKALAAENWDAPVIVTTAVQFFESLYANRSSRCRKLHNIANSVIIFDEAQTLPVPYLRPCVAAIAQLVRCYNASAVLCTATQPALDELFKEFAPGLEIREICSGTEALYRFFRRTSLQRGGELSTETLARQLNAVPQALCVVNRRSAAQEIYRLLGADGRYCLTTLLCPADRKRLLAEIRARLKGGLPCRVAATSLIEAGVDVDFPAAWREEAGLDSVLQTAGRCNREGRRSAEESVVTVFTLEGQKPLSMLRQNISSAQRTMDKYADPASPEAIKEYFEFYRQLKGDKRLDAKGILPAFEFRPDRPMLPFATVAGNFHIIENNTLTVYIPTGEGEARLNELRGGNISRRLYRRLGQYAVNVYPDHLKALDAAGAVEQISEDAYALRDLSLYDGQTGLKLDIETGQGIFI